MLTRIARPFFGSTALLVSALVLCRGVASAAHVELESPETEAGYVARLLINEVPFPGDDNYRSKADSKAAMLAILWVLDSRIYHIPAGYQQKQIANVETRNIVDVITAGGQVQGFYRDRDGRFKAVRRVLERVDYLEKVANQGSPGTFAELLNYAQSLASGYFRSGPDGPDIFEPLRWIGPERVTGRAYSWMTDALKFDPGGQYVRIPDRFRGRLGGNRFFTLKRMR